MTEKAAHGNQIVMQWYCLPHLAGLMHRSVEEGTTEKSKFREGSFPMTLKEGCKPSIR